jgi:hypothetical protein
MGCFCIISAQFCFFVLRRRNSATIHLLPADLVEQSVFLSGAGLGCLLVEATAQPVSRYQHRDAFVTCHRLLIPYKEQLANAELQQQIIKKIRFLHSEDFCF